MAGRPAEPTHLPCKNTCIRSSFLLNSGARELSSSYVSYVYLSKCIFCIYIYMWYPVPPKKEQPVHKVYCCLQCWHMFAKELYNKQYGTSQKQKNNMKGNTYYTQDIPNDSNDKKQQTNKQKQSQQSNTLRRLFGSASKNVVLWCSLLFVCFFFFVGGGVKAKNQKQKNKLVFLFLIKHIHAKERNRVKQCETTKAWKRHH